MAIKKQEFYEGAALHILARSGKIESIRYKPPFFTFNEDHLVLLKYSAKVRSPWSFTFTADEQKLMQKRAANSQVRIALVCGSDGVASLPYEAYLGIASLRGSSVHISCFRDHNERYEVNGPDGALDRKVASSAWQRILG